MATFVHLAAGAVSGAIHARATAGKPSRSVLGFATLALAPDLDLLVVPFAMGGTPLEHRVMTHAIPFAIAVGALVTLRLRGRPGSTLTGALVAATLASHGIIDSMTSIGFAPRLFWPLTRVRVAFPWQPIPGLESFLDYFTLAALPNYLAEATISVPLILIAALTLWAKPSPKGAASFGGD